MNGDDDHKHFLATTVSPPHSRKFRNPELWNRKNPICDAMRGGFSGSDIAHAAAATSNGARFLFLNTMNEPPLPPTPPLPPKKKKAWYPIVIQNWESKV
jgi:hypothetical protein